MSYPPSTKTGTFSAHATLSLLGLIATLLAGPSALAQTRTPTSPLDRPETTGGTPTAGQTPVPTPNGPSDFVAPTRIELPTPVLSATAIDRARILPDGVSSSDGLTEDDVVARATETGVAARRAALRVESFEAAERVARRGFVPRTSAAFRYTRLSSYTPGSIAFFDTAGCVSDIPACQANPASYQRDVVLQQAILDQYALTGSVVVPLSDYVGTTRHDLRAARADADAARAQAEASLDDARLDGRDAYWELVRARAQLRLAEESASNAARKRDEARERRTHGVGTDSDVQDAEATDRAYGQLVDVARTRVEIGEQSLRDLLALDDGAPVVLAVDLEHLPDFPALASDEARAEAESNAPRVLAARSSADAANARVASERGRIFPAVSASFNATYANPNQRIFPQTTSFTGTWDAGVQVSWSLDGALLSQGRLSQRRALAQDAELAVEEAEQLAGRTAIAARGEWLAALANVDAREAAAAAAETRARSAAERRAAGITTDTDVRDADAAFLRARLDLVDAIVDVHRAHARLVAALGTRDERAPSSRTSSPEVTP